jgi:hypothetical protein
VRGIGEERRRVGDDAGDRLGDDERDVESDADDECAPRLDR